MSGGFTGSEVVALIRKPVTERFAAANRANSLKSSGPKAEAGKKLSSRNSAKHLVFAKVFPATMKELGEDPADFNKLRERLHQAFNPQDGFEEMLVEDMAVTRWRLARLRRAEMGILAVQQFKLEHRLRAAPAKREASYDNIMVQSFGLAGVSDSPEKYIQILELLRSLLVSMEGEGFTPQGFELLKTVYGSSPGVPGVGLMAHYKAQLERQTREGQPDGEEESKAARKSFLESLRREIEAVGLRAGALQLAQHTPLPESLKDAQLIPAEEDMDRILRYETALERQFERKVQQLVAWRRERAGQSGSGFAVSSGRRQEL